VKILLLGKIGQVGWELQRALAPLGELIALGQKEEAGLCGDLEQADSICQTVQEVKPDVIVNAAAYTAVDQAESEAELAEQINAIAPGILAEEAARQGAWFVHYSTDYIFDGSGTTPWREDDAPAPLNVYGATKWRGEEAVRQASIKHLIFRTQWVYAQRGNNFIRTMLRLASEREGLKVIDDQVGAPTGAELIADITAHAIRMATGCSDLAGTYHLAARGETTWYGYARFVIDAARKAGWSTKVSNGAIKAVDSASFSTPAIRPHNSRLALEKIEGKFGLTMPDWRMGVRRALTEIMSENQLEGAV
jgi:dTDP-4-dehydrorhamnose reductase